MVEMELKYRVLNALSQTDGYVSGGEMAARFNVSRTLVWKAVNQLRRDGHAISTVNKLGYRLEIQTDIINPHVIEDYLEKSFATQKQKPTFRIESLDEIDSTNEYLKRLANAGTGEIAVAVADRQTQGKGRNGKSFFPLRLRTLHKYAFKTAFRRAGGAVSHCRRKRRGRAGRGRSETFFDDGAPLPETETKIKWVNDLYLDGKKYAGFLPRAASTWKARV